jgi:hypothetical protein
MCAERGHHIVCSFASLTHYRTEPARFAAVHGQPVSICDGPSGFAIKSDNVKSSLAFEQSSRRAPERAAVVFATRSHAPAPQLSAAKRRSHRLRDVQRAVFAARWQEFVAPLCEATFR